MTTSSDRTASARTLRGLLVLALLGLALLLVVLLREAQQGTTGDETGRAARGSSQTGLGTTGAEREDPVTLAGGSEAGVPAGTLDARLRVVGRFGEPLPDYPVRIRRGEAEEDLLTDAHGSIRVPAVVQDGSVFAEARPPPTPGAHKARPSVQLREDEEILRVAEGTLLELDLRDAETGEPLEGGRWRYRQRILRVTTPWHAAGEATSLPFPAGGRVLLHLEVEAPAGSDLLTWAELISDTGRSPGPQKRAAGTCRECAFAGS